MNEYRRNAVVEAMVNKLKNVTVGSDYTKAYREVTRNPIGHENVDKINFQETLVGVYDINEEKTRSMSYTNASLTVVVEFYYKPKIGEDKSKALNILLAEITKALMVDQTLNSNSIMVEDTSNNIDIDGIYDKIINGSITFQVLYRHGRYDPTKPLC